MTGDGYLSSNTEHADAILSYLKDLRPQAQAEERLEMGHGCARFSTIGRGEA